MITWISVKERLPKLQQREINGSLYDVSQFVLVHTKNEEKPVDIGYLEGNRWVSGDIYRDDVTHWAHINLPNGHLL